jgi:hypothetical protein
VPAVSDAQPTIPIRALGESVPDRTAGTAAARMFVLTTDLAGMEFKLDRASLVIGRTDENDIVLGHRSISRHHAKIVRDGDHYTIVDLQSANGVRVNGEDYERIELNPGDIIELGHVKLRFVGPFETFVFKPQSRGLTMASKIAIGAGGGLVLLAAAFVLFPRKHDAPEAPPPAVAAAVPAPAPAAPPPAPEPAVAAPASDPLPSASPAAIFAEAKQAAGAEDWEKSRATLERMGPIEDPTLRRDAATLRRRIDIERQGAVLFAQFDEASTRSSTRRRWRATSRSRRTAVTSAARSRATTRRATLLVSEHMAAADKRAHAGHCAEVKHGGRRDRPPRPAQHDRARDGPPVPPGEGGGAPPPAGRGGARREAPSQPDADATERRPRGPSAEAAPSAGRGRAGSGRADEAGARGVAAPAVRRGRRSVAQGAAREAGDDRRVPDHRVCSCTLKDADAAARAYAKLDDKNRNLVRALCQKNGVTVGD